MLVVFIGKSEFVSVCVVKEGRPVPFGQGNWNILCICCRKKLEFLLYTLYSTKGQPFAIRYLCKLEIVSELLAASGASPLL
jgi:hypothetical protein